MTLTRRTAVTAALAGAGALPINLASPARAAEFTVKIGHGQTAAHPLDPLLRSAAETIKADTGGRVELQVFGNSALGSEPQMLSQVRSGALDMTCTSMLLLEGTFAPVSISGLAFTYRSSEDGWAAWDGDFGSYLRAGVEKGGLLVLETCFEHGFRETTTAVRPIVTPDDLRGVKIRVPAVPIWTTMYEQFGASPTTIAIKEVYSALQTRIADAQENPLASIDFFKLYEVQKFCSMTHHVWDPFCMFASPRRMAALPKDLRDTVFGRINEAAIEERRQMRALNDGLRAQLEKSGLVFNEPNAEVFRKKLTDVGFYKTWKDKYDPVGWALFEKYAGKLG